MTLEILNKMDKESVYVYDINTHSIVATLTRHVNDACEVYYTLCVDWEAYDALGSVNPIPGYDLTLRKDVYIRDTYTVFMTEFLPPAGREDSYIDIFGHMHTSQFNYSDGYCFVPSYFEGGSKRGACHLRIYFDEDTDIKYMVFMPLTITDRLIKNTEIIYEKRLTK